MVLRNLPRCQAIVVGQPRIGSPVQLRVHHAGFGAPSQCPVKRCRAARIA